MRRSIAFAPPASRIHARVSDMLAVVSTSPGLALENLEVRDNAVPSPGVGELLVRMLASPINYSDVITLSGAYLSRTSYPFVPGFEGVGEVVACGDDADASMVGRHVVALRAPGSWQQYRTTHQEDCVFVPEGIPTEVSGFCYVNPMTALLLTRSVDPSRSSTALLSAPGSVMGRYLAELLSGMGIRVFGLSSGRSPVETLSRFAGDVVSGESPDWPQRLASKMPKGADLILDSVGGETLRRLVEYAAPGARCVQYGLLSGDQRVPDRVTRGLVTFEYFHLRKQIYDLDEQETASAFESVFNLFREGRFESPPFREVDLSSVPGEVASGRWSSRPRTLIRPQGLSGAAEH